MMTANGSADDRRSSRTPLESASSLLLFHHLRHFRVSCCSFGFLHGEQSFIKKLDLYLNLRMLMLTHPRSFSSCVSCVCEHNGTIFHNFIISSSSFVRSFVSQMVS